MNKFKGVEGDVAWHGAQAYYDSVREIENFMAEKRDNGDIWGYFNYLKDLIRKAIPYTYSLMSDKEVHLLTNHDDIINFQNELKPGNTDQEMRYNNNLKANMQNLIEQKYDLIVLLMAKAKLYLPLNVKQEDTPLAFSQDGK